MRTEETTVRLPKDLLADVERIARKHYRSTRREVIVALEAYVADGGIASPATRDERVPDGTYGGAR